ncbi:unnamed protein product [Coffea canephora]|uniref:MLO-like protein n=1 Tax=Coffea canephora TaxID=49390 RepID=A0A068TU29_COFCA|nr:unnamed protein product [Coffea canephora]
MAGESKELTLQETPTWAVAVICFILVAISIMVEFLIHLLASWLKKKRKQALHDALEKIKAELMLLGFISLLLTVVQDPISKICIPKSAGRSWHPCRENDELDGEKFINPCQAKGKSQLVSEKGLHELHIFIFMLAAFHVLYCITTLGLGRLKMRVWKAWEDETKTLEYTYHNDPDRFRFARDTSFGRRHLHFWSKSPILLWIVCFFRQFFASVTKVDYVALRHGFIIAHLAPQNHTTFDFRSYIKRSLEEDFKVVVGISPIIWLFAVLFLMSNTHGWHSYLWLPFIPLAVILLVGTKLQVIITKMGLRIQERGDVVKGTPVVETGDHLFWFNRPRLLLYLIQFVLFQNAFQMAFFAFTWYKYGVPSCFHKGPKDIAIRLSVGIVTQVLCSYVTLPLYALVTQMGTTMKPVIFDEKVSSALKSWHKTAKKNIKEDRKSGSTTPFSSRPGTPLHGMSPVHLLQGFRCSTVDDDSLQATPRGSNSDNEIWDHEALHNADDNAAGSAGRVTVMHHTVQEIQLASTSRISPKQRSVKTQHEVNIGSTDFSFK